MTTATTTADIIACPWCLEGEGWCDTTGGPNPCEGGWELTRAIAQMASAPLLIIPARSVG